MKIKRWISQQNKERRDHWVKGIAHSMRTGSRVLDLGAGGCPYRTLFAHCDYRTQDFVALSPGQLTQGGYGKIDFVCDATDIPAASDSFDAVLCTEVLEHVPEPDRVIREIARLLRPGGWVYLSAPLGSGLHQEPFHYYGGFTPHWYKRVFLAAGFTGIVVEANGGSFMHFSQWCVWIVKASRPWLMPFPMGIGLLLTPLWLASLPVLAGLFLTSRFLDRFDRVQQFTVGYHVRAQKNAAGAGLP